MTARVAELAAAGDVSVAGESAKLSLSGALNADAQSIKLHTDTLETMTSQLSATIAEAASLHTTDASLSASGTLSAYMAGGEVVAEGTGAELRDNEDLFDTFVGN